MAEPLVIVDGELDPKVVGQLIGEDLGKASLKTLDDKQGGLSGDFFLVECQDKDGKLVASLVLKKTGEGREAQAVSLGTAREGKFFQVFGNDAFLSKVLPKAYFGFGDLGKGIKQVLMRHEKGVPAGVYFGKGNPNNWQTSDRDLEALCKAGPTPLEASRAIFTLYAKLHARYWQNESMLDHKWLRGSDWLKGEGRDSWETAQSLSSTAWTALKAQDNFSHIFTDPHLIACLDKSFSKCNWDAYQLELKNTPWTIVQADAHPHNVLHLKDENRFILIDFEMVGLGSNAQELGQFLISHAQPDFRRQNEHELVSAYHQDLVSAVKEANDDGLHSQNISAYDYNACWSEYIKGGAGRWIWFVPYLAKICPPSMAIFFHNQLAAFLKDHFPSPDDVPMPRV